MIEQCSKCKKKGVKIVKRHRPSGRLKEFRKKNFCVNCMKKPKWKALG